MTRPMPGPPEHDFDSRDHDGDPDECCWICHYINVSDYWAAPHRRLTDAECAAEYWRAMFDAEYETPHGYERQIVIVRTWHRFATRPHALEEA